MLSKITLANNMASLPQKAGLQKENHLLQVEIHYLKALLTDDSLIYIEIKRGKDQKSDSNSINYTSSASQVNFNFTANFDIVMRKTGKKYEKKYFSLKLFQLKDNTKTENGRVKIDFSRIPSLKKPIFRREISLQHCSDKQALLCISVTLDPINITGKAPPSSTVFSLANYPKGIDSNEKELKPKDTDSDCDSNVSINDLIVNPKDSEIKSESSSSEEECKELPPDKIVGHSLPKSSKEDVTPNQNSNTLQIAEPEHRDGDSICVKCIIS